MIELVLLTSLKILFVYKAMHEGMILRWLYSAIHKVLALLPSETYLWVQKPFTSCLFCMASIWGCLFTLSYFSFTWQYLTLLFAIAGMNYIIGAVLARIEWMQEEEI